MSRKTYDYDSRKVRFFRSRHQGWLSGVCAGIADYFDWDLKTVRVLAIILLLVFPLASMVAYALTTVLTDRI